jgi:hypothetical protein
MTGLRVSHSSSSSILLGLLERGRMFGSVWCEKNAWETCCDGALSSAKEAFSKVVELAARKEW